MKLYFSRKISIRQKKECRTEPQCRKQKKKRGAGKSGKMSVPGLVAAGHYAEIAENVDLEYKIIGDR